jgi:hypothetical protein
MQGFRCCRQQEISGCGGDPSTGFMPLCGAARGEVGKSLRMSGHTQLDLPRSECVALGTGKLHVMDVANHCRVTCTKGAVWVTGSNRRCDYVLEAGESLLLQGRSRIIVSGGHGENTVWICRG